ncbi:hypothetical protein [Vibrio sp. Vb339]|uniref:hypothetical protein n=1 Tax=Vibrio sp. Vb339 TaxID=1192013 RepID=UPI0015578985|nr:hypothetical protein [Vibrio sp. Vb339]
MSIGLKGIELDRVIEKELIKMCDEGFLNSPITQANLFKRLKAQGVINSKATLTNRRHLINHFIQQQKDDVKGPLGETLKTTSSMTRKDLERANARLSEQSKEARNTLKQNTDTIIQIVKTIRLQTNARNIERCLSPYLIRELHRNED